MNTTTRVILKQDTEDGTIEFTAYRNNDNTNICFQSIYQNRKLTTEFGNPLASLLDELGILEKALEKSGGSFEMIIDFNVKIENNKQIEASVTVDNQLYYQEKVWYAKIDYLDSALFHKIGWLFFEGPYEYNGNIDNKTSSMLERYF